MKRLLALFVCTSTIVLASYTHAASVHVFLLNNHVSGNWDIWAATSPGDNDGIAGFNIEMHNYGTGQIDVPIAFFPGPFVVGGFTVGGADIPDAGGAGDALFAGMNSSNPNTLIYGVGSPDEGGRIPTYVPPPGTSTRQIPWNDGSPIHHPVGLVIPAYAVHIGSGTTGGFRGGGFPAIGALDFNLFKAGQAAVAGTETEAATQIFLNTNIIPEPTTFVLCGIALLGLGLLRGRL